MAALGDFAVESLANLVGAFAGVSLALLAERSSRRDRARETETEQRVEHAATRSALLSSVVKNVAECRRLKRALAAGRDHLLLDVSPELSVWEATRAPFIALSRTVDERVLYTRFFDEVRRLDHLLAFRRDVYARRPAGSGEDPSWRRAVDDLDARIESAAEDVQLAGTVLVTDHGDLAHRRLLGLVPAAAPPSSTR